MGHHIELTPNAAIGAANTRAAFRARLAAVLLGSTLSLTQATWAHCETLMDALSATYQTNPQLDAERARSRATDENVSQAQGQFRPTITGNANYGGSTQRVRPADPFFPDGSYSPHSWGVTVNQPIFRGFRTINGINVAEAQVRGERETLRNTEQTVLIGAITAFMDVVRDEAILSLRENNRKVLADTLKSTQDQFRVGEVTRTDVAQSEASLAAAVSAIELAKANLKGSRANYERWVGHPPGTLVEPRSITRLLPKSIDEAVSIAEKETPTVLAAMYNEQAARFNVELIRGQLLPTLSVQGTFEDSGQPSRITNDQQVATVTGQLSVPLYEQGIVYSQVRQAKHQQIAALQEIQRSKVEAHANAIAAWSQDLAAHAQLTSDQEAVRSNKIALTGVREEEKVGQRTHIEVLNAEQAYLNAQVNLVGTRHNVIVNDYALMQAIGRLNVQEIGGSDQVYDTEQNYFEVRRKWWGLDITHADGSREALDLWKSHGENHESMK